LNFFRDDDKLNELTADDRVEIFRQVLIGSSDITKKLLDEVLSDICVANLSNFYSNSHGDAFTIFQCKYTIILK